MTKSPNSVNNVGSASLPGKKFDLVEMFRIEAAREEAAVVHDEDGAKERLATVQALCSRAESARAAALRSTIAEAVATRTEAAREIERIVPELYAAWVRVEDATAQIRATELVPDGTRGFVFQEDIEAALRFHLKKCGFAWAVDYPWPVDALPDVSARLARANDYVLTV